LIKTFGAAAFAAAIALTASAEPPPPTPQPHYGQTCFWQRDVVNFAAHDDSAIYVRAGVNRIYELKMFGNCFNLSWLHHIGLRTFSGGNICEGRTPNVDVFTRDIATGPQQCPVTSVRKLTPEEVAALPKDARP
jgi:hypothetical protein